MSDLSDTAVVEYIHRRTRDGFWLEIHVDRKPWAQIGPFDTAAERQRCHDDMMTMMKSQGAIEVPVKPQ